MRPWWPAPISTSCSATAASRQGRAASLAAVLDKAQARLDAGKKDAGVAAELRTRAGHLAGAAAGTRQGMLARVIDAIAAKLS